MRLYNYIQDKRGQMFAHSISMILLSTFLMLTGTQRGVVILILLAWVMGLVLQFGIAYYKNKKHLEELHFIMNGLDKKYLFMECAGKPLTLMEKELFLLMRRAGKAMIEDVSDAEVKQKEYKEYIEEWVHEIKAPITAAQLLCSNHKSEFTPKLLNQLTQIEENVERVLYYARADSVEKDFMIRKIILADIVKDAVSRHQTLLIQNGVRIETEGLDAEVYTDDKWVVFMLRQILSNAVRYKKEQPLIRFQTNKSNGQVCLTVTDYGMGIAPDELPRVFERGFSGSNGRIREQSTGMGLYICKKLSYFLQITLKIDSVQNEFTTVQLLFPSQSNLTKR